ncbi:hypothetical protein [Luteirhabdus pelagi]|uniref:hypothetical protein n=1 Tax=Luteirhabdus pelagi TaxID=2792783 RepID=UPI00193A66DD|nr:hypothetical protein [Luteirhabdus pelagi]
MTALTKLFIKTFLLTGIPFAIGMMGLHLIGGEALRIEKFLIYTTLFGGIMALSLIAILKYHLRKIGIQKIAQEHLGVHQKRTIISTLSIEELLQMLKDDPVFQLMVRKEIENGILLQSTMTMKSWGEEIRIQIVSDRGSSYQYEISSRPRLKTTLIDYGKNLQNIRRMEALLTGTMEIQQSTI